VKAMTMTKKTLMAVAVAFAFSLPTGAQTVLKFSLTVLGTGS
jgi:hypothetical protein